MVLALALLDNASSNLTVGGFFAGVLSGVIVFVLARMLVEAHETGLRVQRLRRSLVCDCALLIQSMKRVLRQIAEFDAIKATGPSSQNVAELYTGFVVSGPLDQTKELIALVDPDEGGLITYLLDRWDRFSGVESRYNVAHGNLVLAAAKIDGKADDAEVQRYLLKEYWADVENELRTLKDCAEDIFYVACKLIRQCQSSDSQFTDVSKVSLNHWKTWEAFAFDESACSKVWEKKRS